MERTPTAFALLALVLGLGVCEAHRSGGSAAVDPTAAVVINAVENMHSGPMSSSDVVSQAILGTNVTLLKKERNSAGEDWHQVETPDTYKGWIISTALRFINSGEAPYASSGSVFVVSALLANTYLEPDVTEHKPVKAAPISAVLEVVREQDGRWIEINLPGNTKAWIQRGDGDIRRAPWSWPRISAEDMVALAKRFLGLPYAWGGTSPFGLDCSGFVQLVYKLSGIPILRDAGIQMTDSGLLEVAGGNERAGDLVFFGKGISHVGMMINSEEFINATVHETPCVRIDRLKDEYWQKIYQGARRPKS